MNRNAVEIAEKVRQQFNSGPYPRIPLEKSPKNNAKLLYLHHLSIPYYLRNRKVIETEGKLILDAGCGSGYMSLVLAQANPGAKIIGVDLSEKSVELARQRLHYHGFTNAEFYSLALEELPQLNLEFDYINCDEVLYLLPDPTMGLQAMRKVLKLDGTIRTNFHSSLQRAYMYRAQEVFKLMGLMDGNPTAKEIETVRDLMKALQDKVILKAFTWKQKYETDDELVLMNYLFQGDKGYTIPEVFSFLETANLELISMVNWWQWNLPDLFSEPNNLPESLTSTLPKTARKEQLHLFELLNPIHRLLDFWCGHPDRTQPFIPVTEWTLSDWQNTKARILPQLKTPEIEAELIYCLKTRQRFELSRSLEISNRPVAIENTAAACLLPLWTAEQPVKSLVERWQKLKSVDSVTLEPTTEQEAWNASIELLTALESLGYVLLERS